MITTSIRASLSEKLLANSDRYYTADIAQMVDEIVQNARRAGARTMRASLVGDVLTLADDGRGLTAEAAPVLLQLGGSNNSDAVETAENAAGVGFFSMAHADVVVRSHDWEMTVPKEAFTGRAAASLTAGLTHHDGLALTLSGLKDRPRYGELATGDTLIAATRYSGLRLVLTGFGPNDGVHEPRNFLADAAGESTESRIAETHGLTIKLVRRPGPRSKAPVRINFFGKVIAVPSCAWMEPIVDEVVGVITSAGKSYESVVTTTYSVDVLIEVRDTSVLRLQLPERNAPIYDAGYALVGETVAALYRDLLTTLAGPNGVPMHAAIRQTLGARLAPPQSVIHAGLEGRYDEQRILGISTPTGIAAPNGKHYPLERCLAIPGCGYLESLIKTERAQQALDELVFVKAGDIHKAYPPEAVATPESVALVLKVDGEEHRVIVEGDDLGSVYEALVEAEIPTQDRLVEDAALILTVRGRDYVAPIPGLVFAEWDDNDQAGVFVVHGQESHTIIDLMLASIGWWDEESDYRDSRNEAYQTYRRWVANLLGTSEELFRERLTQAVRNEAYDFTSTISDGTAVEFTVRIAREGGILSVTADRVLPQAA